MEKVKKLSAAEREKILAEKRAYKRKYYKENREKILATHKRFREENPEKIKAYQERYWLKKATQKQG